jgi:microcystin-dependent protein
MNVLSQLAIAYNWEQYGTMTSEQASEMALSVYNEMRETGGWCMIGSIFPYASAGTPNNCLDCDGSEHNRVDYPQLYAVLDSAFIIDADTFITPDLRGRVAIGVPATLPVGDVGVGETGGEYEHTLITNELASHLHTTNPHTHSEVTAVPTAVTVGLEPPVPSAVPGASITGAASPSTNNTGGDGAHNNIQPYIGLKYAMVAR